MSNSMNRRNFVKATIGTIAAIPVVQAFAEGEMPMLAVDDAQAKALGYIEDSSAVDSAKHPNHSPEQLCVNCALYTGDAESEAGGCGIFPGKLVAANGWCVAYAPKPA